MGRVYNSVEEIIGHTPLMELNNLEKKLGLEAKILAKLEYLNPAGSIKDRAAKSMIDDAEARGLLKEGSVIIEPTSGNTGIGLAAIAAVRGYKLILTMPDTMSLERRNILKAYGAEIVLTEGAKGMAGSIEMANELAASMENSFIPYGSESDNYSILATILEYKIVKNPITQEELYSMVLSCNDMVFNLCMNTRDLQGMPMVGARFKGNIWMQGFVR